MVQLACQYLAVSIGRKWQCGKFIVSCPAVYDTKYLKCMIEIWIICNVILISHLTQFVYVWRTAFPIVMKLGITLFRISYSGKKSVHPSICMSPLRFCTYLENCDLIFHCNSYSLLICTCCWYMSWSSRFHHDDTSDLKCTVMVGGVCYGYTCIIVIHQYI